MHPYSVVITTFDKRFRDCLVPLIQAIRQQRPQVEIIVMVNGKANADFDEHFRVELLDFLSKQARCFPTIFRPQRFDGGQACYQLHG